MDEDHPQAEALVTKHGKILALGSEKELAHHVGPLTKRVELGTKVLYPGLIEPHMHMWVTAINYEWLDRSFLSNKTLDDVKANLRRTVSYTKLGELDPG